MHRSSNQNHKGQEMTTLEVTLLWFLVSTFVTLLFVLYRNNGLYEDMQWYKNEWGHCADKLISVQKAIACANELELRRLQAKNDFDEQC
jgi:hypothetical protein